MRKEVERMKRYGLIGLILLAILVAPAMAQSSITLDPQDGTVGTTVKVTGSGFGTCTEFQVLFNKSVYGKGEDWVVVVLSVRNDTAGGFNATFTVPNVAFGEHTVRAICMQGATGQAADEKFTVVPALISVAPSDLGISYFSINKTICRFGESIRI
ncbi:MAG: hypothetical protein NZ894_03480, partial [Archaeoglobaceae archaeon]|nr:hypothetical protein [Archaeoglobaceae archaeon]